MLISQHFRSSSFTRVPSGSFVRLCLRRFNLFLFITKREPLVGETLIEIESAVPKQTKNCDFVSFKTFCQ